MCAQHPIFNKLSIKSSEDRTSSMRQAVQKQTQCGGKGGANGVSVFTDRHNIHTQTIDVSTTMFPYNKNMYTMYAVL